MWSYLLLQHNSRMETESWVIETAWLLISCMTSGTGYNLGLHFPVYKMSAWDQKSNVVHSNFSSLSNTQHSPEFEPNLHVWVENTSLVSFSLHVLVTWYPLSTSSSSLRLLTGAWSHLCGLLSLAQPQSKLLCRSLQFGMLLKGMAGQPAPCQPQPCCSSPVPMTAQASLSSFSGKTNGIIKYSKSLK